MHVKTLQIAWHENQPVFSCDFHASGKLVTCGADHEIKVWSVSEASDGAPTVAFEGSLANHTKAVNCIRFHPQAGDGGEMMVWKPPPQGGGDLQSIQHWKVASLLRGHSDDVLDMAWSHDGSGLASSSIENTVIVWDMDKCKKKQSYTKHKHYVQGVAWDPWGDMIVSQSLDRTMKVLGSQAHKRKRGLGQPDVARTSDFHVLSTVYKHAPAPAQGAVEAPAAAAPESASDEQTAPNFAAPAAPPPAAAPAAARAEYIFQDESLNTFFRRLAFSPDGSFLVAPAATLGSLAASNKCANAAVIFTRRNLSAPCAVLPSIAAASTCVRFCPRFFKTRHPLPLPASPAAPATGAAQSAACDAQSQDATSPEDVPVSGGDEAACGGGEDAEAGRLSKLPYKLVFAVGCTDSVIIYDTDSDEPLAVLGAIHYKHVTDMAWAHDGSRLAITSHDGYCTLASFRPGELGEPLPEADTPDVAAIKAEIFKHEGHKAKKQSGAKQQKRPMGSASATPSAPPPTSPGSSRPQPPSAEAGASAPTGTQTASPSGAVSMDDEEDGDSPPALQVVHRPTTKALSSPAAAGAKRRLSPVRDGTVTHLPRDDAPAGPPAKRRLVPQPVIRDAPSVDAPTVGAHKRRLIPQAVSPDCNGAHTGACAQPGHEGEPVLDTAAAHVPGSRVAKADVDWMERGGADGQGSAEVEMEPVYVRGELEELIALPDACGSSAPATAGLSLAMLAAQAGAAADDSSDDE